MLSRKIFRQWSPAPMILFALFYLFLITSSQPDESRTLLMLKSALQNSNGDLFRSWTESNSVCNYSGIVCNSNGLVAEIKLANKQLLGTLPFDSICELQSLEKISMGSNFLHGSISEDLRRCTNLQHLDLGGNSFTGVMPDLSPLNKLKYLNLSASGISGAFPWKSLENLTSLTFLSLGDNYLEKSPFPLEVLKLEKLYSLYLTNCSITGKIPLGIGNLTLLENLELSDNQLIGQMPSDIGKLQNLWQLELYDNFLSGKFPDGLGNLTSLVNFDASHNQLEGDLYELRSLKNLVSLQLFENQFSGGIPEELGNFRNLSELSLYSNKLTGHLPQKLGSWGGLEFIDVSDNFLSGSIPPDMCRNSRMTDLLMVNNSFTGSIPENYANCSSLKRLRVNNNNFSGIVPSGIWGLPNLVIIDLSMNQFEGSVTYNIAEAKSLAQLFLFDNQFSGELPLTISEVSSLVSIKLSSNQFSGHIPETIGSLKKLSSLILDKNKFSGTIPESLSSCVSLSEINIAFNSLSREIPASLGSLRNLNSLNLSSNRLSGEIPSTLSSSILSLLDLRYNLLFGPIPQSLSIQAFKEAFDGNPGLCSWNLEGFRSCSSDARSSTRTRTRTTLISCFIAAIMVLLVLLACFISVKLKQHKLEQSLSTNSWDLKQYRVLNFNENEVIHGIKQENLIGRGGSGNVYKVVLKSGKELAVKHIWTSHPGDWRSCRSSTAMLKRSSRSLEYDAEVATLSSIRHVNVVKLYCSITSEDSNLLVYEYLPNGSLWDRLHTCRKTEIGWEIRYEIAIGAGRGLEYLHHGCDRQVIHRDVKSGNILLDEDWKPRIADFGLAKIVQGEGNWTNVIAGTLGYMAPEYAYTSKVTEKNDVYSFGVVLMELVTGKRPIEPEFGENKDIVYWVSSNMRSKEDGIQLVDSTIVEQLKEDAVKVLRIAILCTAKIPASRPSMRMVVQMLEEAEPSYLSNVIVNNDGQN
ncbi:hypothetical protein L6164_032692 [Bauhinia variegata]|uniref:Uncharacterized protein n=1 Tax=Bauhinia variegata TaxID=167791 RepID=A0ACB9KPF1_BAUVA|nr:hypothetical protein L6164_032692 [Bauhinia variegata]